MKPYGVTFDTTTSQCIADLAKAEGLSRKSLIREALKLFSVVKSEMDDGDRLAIEGADGKIKARVVL